jgi:mono/diheme cytochrome c family protein
MCHGEDGRGRAGASLEAFSGVQVDATLDQTIREGISGTAMPAWAVENGGPLSDQDVEDIVAYLVGILEGTEPIRPAPTYQPPEIPPVPEVSGDPSEGAVIFQSNCEACHGEEAVGGFGWPLAKEWPGTNPAAFIRQVVEEGIDGTIMPAWSQQSGGPLSEAQIQDVTAYILSLSPSSVSPTPIPQQEGPLGLTVSLILLGVVVAALIVGLVLYYRRA